MDRIAAMRNVEESLTAFERGEIDLSTLEERVRGTLRTYATDLGEDAVGTEGRAYRVFGAADEEQMIVIATTPEEAERRAATIHDVEVGGLSARPLD